MPVSWVTLVASETTTRVLVMHGQDEILRAALPPFSEVRHERAAKTLLEALSLWLDQRVCVALSAAESVDSFRLDLVDELGVGARSVYYAVEPVPLEARRGRRLRGAGEPLRAGFHELRQLWLWASSEREG